MNEYRFATVSVVGDLTCTNANSPTEHFNAITYLSSPEKLVCINNVDVIRLKFPNVEDAYMYCSEHKLIIL